MDGNNITHVETKKDKAFSIVAVAAGGASFLYGLPCAIVALVFASIYKKNVGGYNDMAKLGKTFATITIIINAVALGLVVTYYAICALIGILAIVVYVFIYIIALISMLVLSGL